MTRIRHSMHRWALALGMVLFTAVAAQAQGLFFDRIAPKHDSALTFPEIQKAADAYWRQHPELVGREGSGFNPYKRWEWFWEQRTYGTGKLPSDEQNWRAWSRYVEKNGELIARTLSSSGAWRPLGPRVVDEHGAEGLGRLNCVAFHPADPNTFWVGAPSGGLWKTTDFGKSWSNTTDNLPVLGVSDIAIDPRDPDIMYIATGDGDLGSLSGIQIDQPYHDGDTRSIGVLKSTNGGVTWDATGLLLPESAHITMRRLLLDPLNPNTLIAATSEGLVRTTNAGANWNVVASGHFIDLEFHPTDSRIVYAATAAGGQGNPSAFYRSGNGGVTWEAIVGSEAIRRIKIGVTPAQPNRVDILCSNLQGGLFGIFVSANAGQSFNTNGFTPDSVLGQPNLLGRSDGSTQNGDFESGQGFYDLAYAISPSSPYEMYVGGINTWKTTNGGARWNLTNFWIDDEQTIERAGAQGVDFAHADKHFLKFHPLKPDYLFECSDGGLWYSSDHGSTWHSINSGLEISQVYRISVAATEQGTLIAGRQDNGSYVLEGNTWRKAFGGDGMDCAIDPSNADIMYHAVFNGNFSRSFRRFTEPDDQRTWISQNIPGFGQQFTGAWVTPFVIDPVRPSTIYTGMYHLWRSDDRGDSWFPISPLNVSLEKTDQNGNPLPLQIRTLAVSPANPLAIYVGTFEDISLTTDGGVTWNTIGLRENLTTANTGIIPHPADPLITFVTQSGYEPSLKVFEWNHGTWINLTRNLPNVPVNCGAYSVLDGGGLYVGTDIGVFYLNLANPNALWQPFNDGLPRVPVTDLEIEASTRTLYAATFGRGVWSSAISGTSNGVEPAKDHKEIKDATITSVSPDGLFRISIPNRVDGERAVVYGYRGETLREIAIDAGRSEIDLRGLPSGAYFIGLKSEQYRKLHRIAILK